MMNRAKAFGITSWGDYWTFINLLYQFVYAMVNSLSLTTPSHSNKHKIP